MPSNLRMPRRFWAYLWRAVIGIFVIGIALLIYSTLSALPCGHASAGSRRWPSPRSSFGTIVPKSLGVHRRQGGRAWAGTPVSERQDGNEQVVELEMSDGQHGRHRPGGRRHM